MSGGLVSSATLNMPNVLSKLSHLNYWSLVK